MSAAATKPFQPRLAMPSIRKTRTGNVKNSTGQTLNGAMARADTAPAVDAIKRRRQPQARTMLWTTLLSVTVHAGALARGLDWAGPCRRVGWRAEALLAAAAAPPRASLPVGDPCEDKFWRA